MDKRLAKIAYFFCIPLLLVVPVVAAVRVRSDFLSALQTSAASGEVPVIIVLSDQADLAGLTEPDKEKKRAKLIKDLKDKAEKTQGPLKTYLKAEGSKRTIPFWIINAVAATLPVQKAAAVASFPGVAGVFFDVNVEASATDVVAAAGPAEWNITTVKAPQLWNIGFDGTGVIVANTDTGVDVLHHDLSGNWRGGTNGWFNPYADPLNVQYCKVPNSCSPCELSASVPCDINGHGTGTMGLMVGGSAGGTAIGVAPGAKWIAVKALNDNRSGPSSIILQAFQWILDLPPDDVPAVVNNSWGFPNVNACNTVFQPAVNTMKAAGIEVVFSAGNSGPGTSTSVSPANNPGSLAVGATDSTDTIAFFSSRGPSACDGTIFPHLVAPGAGVKSAIPTAGGTIPNAYNANLSGTSFASPHVAAAIALLVGAFPTLTIPEIESVLASTTNPAVGSPLPNNSYGFGLIDIANAYSSAFTSIEGNRPEIGSSPVSYYFANVQVPVASSKTFTIMNRGVSDLTVNDAEITGASGMSFSIPAGGDSCSGQTLRPFSNCAVSVLYSPAAVGYRTGFLRIRSTDPVTPVVDVPLSGSAVGIIASGAASAPAVAWNATEGKFHVAFRSSNGRIWVGTAKANGEPNGDWLQLPWGWTNDPPAIAWNSTSNKLVIAVASSHDTAVYVANLDSDHSVGSFTGWTRIEATAQYSPAVAWNPVAGRLQLAVHGTNTRIFVANSRSDGTDFSGWTRLPQGSTVLSPSIAWNPVSNKVQIAVKGRDNNRIYLNSVGSDGSGLGVWIQIVPGSTLAAPCIIWDSIENKLVMAVKASVGNSIYQTFINGDGTDPVRWIQLPGSLSMSSPAIAINPVLHTLNIFSSDGAGGLLEYITVP